MVYETRRAQCGSCSQHEAIDKLEAKVKELQRQFGDVAEQSLTDGYEQCLQDMADVVGITQEVTRVLGPAEGLTYLLERLQEKDIVIGHRRGVPHDWLSRWKVELA